MATATKSKKINTALSMEERFPRTISQELFDAWQILRRSGDPELLCKELNLSRPVIDRALNYGHIKRSGIGDEISKFFQKRLDKEKNKGSELLDAAKKS